MRTEHGATLGPFIVAIDGDLNDASNCPEDTIGAALSGAEKLVRSGEADPSQLTVWAQVPIDLVVDVTAKVAGERK